MRKTCKNLTHNIIPKKKKTQQIFAVFNILITMMFVPMMFVQI